MILFQFFWKKIIKLKGKDLHCIVIFLQSSFLNLQTKIFNPMRIKPTSQCQRLLSLGFFWFSTQEGDSELHLCQIRIKRRKTANHYYSHFSLYYMLKFSVCHKKGGKNYRTCRWLKSFYVFFSAWDVSKLVIYH